jgi:hypothetical protein
LAAGGCKQFFGGESRNIIFSKLFGAFRMT